MIYFISILSLAAIVFLTVKYIQAVQARSEAERDAYKASIELQINNRTLDLHIEAATANAALFGYRRFFSELGEAAAYKPMYENEHLRSEKLNEEIKIGQQARKQLAERHHQSIQTINELTLELNKLQRQKSIQTPSKVRQDYDPEPSEDDLKPVETTSQIHLGSNPDGNKIISLRNAQKEAWNMEIIEKNSDWFLRKVKVNGEWLGEFELLYSATHIPQAKFHASQLRPGEFLPLNDHAGVLLCKAPGCNHVFANDMRSKRGEVCSNECRTELDKYKKKVGNLNS